MTLRSAIAEASIHIAQRDAEVLLAHILGRNRAWLFAHIDDPLSADHLAQLRAFTTRRAAQEPLQHLTGQQEFFGLTLGVTRDTLIPRPETEQLVEAVIAWVAANPSLRYPTRILDVGTGTGAIAVALSKNLPRSEVVACDISERALDVARDNASRLELEHRISFFISDLLAELSPELEHGQRFDIIVSNPPYVSPIDAPTLAAEVRDHEPHLALFGMPEQNQDGLGIYRLLIPQAHAALVPNGLLALEIGFGQSDAIRTLFPENEWHSIRVLDDYAGIPRIILAERI